MGIVNVNKNMLIYETVSAVLINKQGKIALFKRAPTKRLNPGKWNFIAEKVKANSFDYIGEVKRGVKEETGLAVKSTLLMPVVWYVFNPKSESNSEDILCRDMAFLISVDENREFILNSEHTEYSWVEIHDLGLYDTVSFLPEALHNVGITTNLDSVYKVLYENYKGEVRWRYIHPIKYYFGCTDYHKKDQWLLHCFDIEKDAERTYAVCDIKVLCAPFYKEK